MDLFDPEFIVIFGTLFGGFVIKSIENFNSKAKEVESKQDKFNRKAAKKLGVKIAEPEETGVYHCTVYEAHTFEAKLAEAGIITKDEITICDNDRCELCKPERNRRIAEFDRKRAEERHALRVKAAKTTKAEYERDKWHPIKELGSHKVLGHYRVLNGNKIEMECNGKRAITKHSQRPDYIYDDVAIQRPDKVSPFAKAWLLGTGDTSIRVQWEDDKGHMYRSDHLKPLKAQYITSGTITTGGIKIRSSCACNVCDSETYGEDTCAPCNMDTYEVQGDDKIIKTFSHAMKNNRSLMVLPPEPKSDHKILRETMKNQNEQIKQLENRLHILSETLDGFSYKNLPDPARSRGRG